MKNKLISIIIFLLVILNLCCVYATNEEFSYAEDISKQVEIEYNEQEIKNLTDGKTSTKVTFAADKEIKIKTDKKIGSIYIKYENTAKQGILKIGEKQYNLGEHGFLHEYLKLENNNDSEQDIFIKYSGKTTISEIYFFTEGQVPDWVQIWEEQSENVDLLLFSTHSDDEHLFFAGLLPTYVAKGYNVQVVYVTNHNDNPTRLHEQLDGLWSVGITNYPIISQFADAYSTSLEGAISNLKKNEHTLEDVIEFQVEQIRKFKPLVIVGHDEKGEYGHGQHILNTEALKQAIQQSNDENYYQETKEQYGLWETPKVYLHLYSKNEIIMNYDIELEYFKGKTAYEMSKIGYSYHLSQQYTWFTKWLKGENSSYTKATQIETYSPTKFGLYFSAVGNDVNKNDMFENIDKSKYRKQENSQEETNTIEQQTEQLILKSELTDSQAKSIVIGLFAIIILWLILRAILNYKKQNKENRNRENK